MAATFEPQICIPAAADDLRVSRCCGSTTEDFAPLPLPPLPLLPACSAKDLKHLMLRARAPTLSTFDLCHCFVCLAGSMLVILDLLRIVCISTNVRR